jgi:hypothetical protein
MDMKVNGMQKAIASGPIQMDHQVGIKLRAPVVNFSDGFTQQWDNQGNLVYEGPVEMRL